MQNARKDAGLQVEDRIVLRSPARRIVDAAESYGEQIAGETLAVELSLGPPDGDPSASLDRDFEGLSSRSSSSRAVDGGGKLEFGLEPALWLRSDDRLHGLPPLNMIIVGIERTPNRWAVWGFSSMSSLTIRRSVRSLAISSSTGATIRHGPHHGAQKSTSTGPEASSDLGVEVVVADGDDVGHRTGLLARFRVRKVGRCR